MTDTSLKVKTKTLDLRAPAMDEERYKVLRVVNSTEFTPGETISKTTVDIICLRPDWQVTITRPNL